MARNQKLITDQDFHEALERQARIRVFRDDHVIDTGGVIIRFDQTTVVVQSSVSDIAFHGRKECEFYEMGR